MTSETEEVQDQRLFLINIIERMHEALAPRLHENAVWSVRPMLSKLTLQDAFASIDAEWRPRIGATIAGVAVKLVRISGDFIWHHHDVEDELFLVVKGELTMRLRDGDVVVRPGEWIVVPHGIEHQPSASTETWILLIEPTDTLNTGNVVSDRTVHAVPLAPGTS